MLRPLGYLARSQKGITGIETAIILIAFVIVAAVFSYAVLSAGLFASQKSQEAVYEGLEDVQGTTKILGAIIATAETPGTGGCISTLSFTISSALSGSPVDFTPPDPDLIDNDGFPAANSSNKVTISYVDPFQKADDLYWTMTRIGKCSADNLLDDNEKFQITIGNPVANTNGGNLVDALTVRPLGIDTKFTLQITTPSGATLILERTTPEYLDKCQSLK